MKTIIFDIKKLKLRLKINSISFGVFICDVMFIIDLIALLLSMNTSFYKTQSKKLDAFVLKTEKELSELYK
jgi:hypothetical protein